jgi:hypothetical protein
VYFFLTYGAGELFPKVSRTMQKAIFLAMKKDVFLVEEVFIHALQLLRQARVPPPSGLAGGHDVDQLPSASVMGSRPDGGFLLRFAATLIAAAAALALTPGSLMPVRRAVLWWLGWERGTGRHGRRAAARC